MVRNINRSKCNLVLQSLLLLWTKRNKDTSTPKCYSITKPSTVPEKCNTVCNYIYFFNIYMQ